MNMVVGLFTGAWTTHQELHHTTKRLPGPSNRELLRAPKLVVTILQQYPSTLAKSLSSADSEGKDFVP